MMARGIILLALVLLVPAAGYGAAAQKQGHEEVVGMMHMLLNVGTEAYKRGDYGLAVRCMRDVVRSEADTGPSGPAMAAHAGLFEGNALLRMGMTDQALARYEAALAASIRGAGDQGTLPSLCRDNIRHVRVLGKGLGGGSAAGRAQRGGGGGSDKYLVFRFWAGLSNRRQELIGMIAAARLLNRTLVLPPLVENRWMAAHEQDRPVEGVENFYDLEVLGAYVRVIDQSDFVRRVVPLLGPLPGTMHIRDYQYIGQLGHLNVGWHDASPVQPSLVQLPRPPADILKEFGGVASPVLAIDFSYRFVDFRFKGEFEFFDGKREWTPPFVRPSFDPDPLHLGALSSLSFAASVREAADRAVAAGGAGGGDFLAVHLRRNDMRHWSNRQHAWTETGDVVRQVANLTRMHGLSRVFLATDAGDAERGELSRALPGAFFAAGGGGGSEAHAALVDQAVCARAAAFVGNFWSTFSLAIIEERHKGGHPPGTSHFFQHPFPGAREGDVRECGDAAAPDGAAGQP